MPGMNRALVLAVVCSSLAVASIVDAGTPVGRAAGGGRVSPSLQPSAPPAAIGWPHNQLASVSSTHCGSTPAPDEVLIGNWKGECLSLAPGFYPNTAAVSHGFLVTSIRVGSAVRARAYRWEEYDQRLGRGFAVYAPGTSLALNGEQQSILSMHVEPNDRSLTCDDVRPGEIALYEGWNSTGDCVVLDAASSYPTAVSMGIANDSISSVSNQTDKRAILYGDMSFVKQVVIVPAHTRNGRLPANADNQASSLQLSN